MSRFGENNGNSIKRMVRTIRIPAFDNSDLIRRLKRTTLIGRIMNPDVQSVGSLVLMMPRVWKLEGRVVGKDLGLVTFRFDFEREEDILEVMKTEPFNFNHWMVSIVRWEPVIHKDYPSAITFWVKMVGVPQDFWTDQDFRRIGNELGTVQEVDEENARVKVTIDSTMQLCFEMSVQFETGGEEVVVKMEYEKLFGYCASCFSLRHDEESCPLSDLHNHVSTQEE
ncbi:hypothetical protein ISN45_Aa07g038960 [Arabidopsis thaliana x Arabidopsis arenosa]|uniref:DUF4283 domain-containing protein n=1 Tax=Arabidopsis thaliana x Arabidopsis arenosa TaxID=1240361 RepID=A0A8T1YDJ8_9BRAS|nr:hypothetical protein ISN45_Aa07g038960 [Arabidopsis thaliana x Arabidopsis arenosa]